MCEFGLTIRHDSSFIFTRRLFCEDTNALSQHGQTLIDVRALLEGVTSGASRCSSLGTCQIDQVDVGVHLPHGLARLLIYYLLLKFNSSHCVRTTASSIHICRGDGPVFSPLINQSLDLIIAGNWVLRLTNDSDSQSWVILHIETALGSLSRANQQILNRLVVDLYHTQCHLVLYVVFRVLDSLLDTSEDFLTCQRHDTLVVAVADDGIGLARTRLSVGKETRMIALERIVKYFLTLNFDQ